MSNGAANAFAVSGSGNVTSNATGGRYMGFSIRDTGGGSVFRVRDGSSSGSIIDSVSLAAGESAREWYGEAHSERAGVNFSGPILYFELVSGAIEGSIRVGV